MNNRPSTYVFHETPEDIVLGKQENKAAVSEVPFVTPAQVSIQTAVRLKSQCVERLCLNISHCLSLFPLLFTSIMFTIHTDFQIFPLCGRLLEISLRLRNDKYR
jgi:hypothetical protein